MGLTRHAAPPGLRAAILAQAPARKPTRWFQPGWGHGASFGAGLAVAASIAVLFAPPAGDDVVAAHIRALQPGHLVDVASTDQHTVKPWFDGRLDYAPPVRDFAAQGYNVASWTQGGMNFRAVSDLNAGALAELGHLIRTPET